MEGPNPGWYPDPWVRGHHRYWDGAAWTGDTFPDEPVPATPAQPEASGPDLPRGRPPPPQWAPPAPAVIPEPTATVVDSIPDQQTKPSWLSTSVGFVVLVAVMALVVGSLAVVGAYYAFGGGARTRPAAARVVPTPGPTFPPNAPNIPRLNPFNPFNPFNPLTPPTTPAPADPSASVLSRLVVTQADVAATAVVQLQTDGDQLAGQPTLDLCNGNFPSESARTGRLQVIASETTGQPFLSTEAVLYAKVADTTEAFTELKAVAAACPAQPVPSPAGGPTTTTHFNPPPDTAWPAVATVERLAFDTTETGADGVVAHSVRVFLRRGRVLVGVYFYRDGAQPAVAGQTTMSGIANVFATRLAQLPASVING